MCKFSNSLKRTVIAGLLSLPILSLAADNEPENQVSDATVSIKPDALSLDEIAKERGGWIMTKKTAVIKLFKELGAL